MLLFVLRWGSRSRRLPCGVVASRRARVARRATSAGVLETPKIIAVAHGSPDALIDHVVAQIVQVLDIDACQFVPGAGPGEQDARPRPRRLRDPPGTSRGRRGDSGLPTDEQIGLIVRRAVLFTVSLCFTAATRVAVACPPNMLRVAVLLADQVGAALTHSELNGALRRREGGGGDSAGAVREASRWPMPGLPGVWLDV